MLEGAKLLKLSLLHIPRSVENIHILFQEEEVYYESFLQAVLQIFIIVIEYDDIPSTFNAVLRVGSIVISCLSLFYGLCKIDLMKISSGEVETRLIMKQLFTELMRKISLILRALLCFSLYYVYEYMLACAIVYTCTDLCCIFLLYRWLLKLKQSTVQQSPVQQSTVQQSTVQQSPVEQSPVQQSPVQQSPVQQSPVQQSTEQQSTEHQSTVQQSTEQQSTEQQSTVQQSTVQQSTEQHSTVQHSTVQRSTVHIMGIKAILDPSRILFELNLGELNTISSSIITLWYSLLCIIFSIISILLNFNCNEIESCDQFDRISRFYEFLLSFSVLSFFFNMLSVVML